MTPDIDPTWLQTVRQQMAAYQQQTDTQLGAATYHQALNYPRQYGFGRMANALTGPAGPPNNPSTGLFTASNPAAANYQLINYFANAPGGNTIGLPTDGTPDLNQNPELIRALLSRSGLG